MNTDIIVVIAIILVIGFIVYFKKSTSGINKIESLIANKLQIKPHLVSEMISAMGSSRGSDFINQITINPEENLEMAIKTMVVYRIMKNDHESEISWWKGKVRDAGYNPNMTNRSVAEPFMYLRDAGANIDQIPKFLQVYNSIE